MSPWAKAAITTGLVAGAVVGVFILIDHVRETRAWRVFNGGRR